MDFETKKFKAYPEMYGLKRSCTVTAHTKLRRPK